MRTLSSLLPEYACTRKVVENIKSRIGTAALRGLARRIATHREMEKLNRLDAHLLRDLGLQRADLDWARQQSECMDPLAALELRRNENMYREHLSSTRTYCRTVSQENSDDR